MEREQPTGHLSLFLYKLKLIKNIKGKGTTHKLLISVLNYC